MAEIWGGFIKFWISWNQALVIIRPSTCPNIIMLLHWLWKVRSNGLGGGGGGTEAHESVNNFHSRSTWAPRPQISPRDLALWFLTGKHSHYHVPLCTPVGKHNPDHIKAIRRSVIRSHCDSAACGNTQRSARMDAAPQKLYSSTQNTLTFKQAHSGWKQPSHWCMWWHAGEEEKYT